MSSSVRPAARYASAVSGDRLSKYSTATLLRGAPGWRPGSARAARHGGGEPSGHWAAVGLTVGPTDTNASSVSVCVRGREWLEPRLARARVTEPPVSPTPPGPPGPAAGVRGQRPSITR